MVDNNQLEEIFKNDWNINKTSWNKLDKYNKEYTHMSLAKLRSKETYIKRIKAINFVDNEYVLDAACGIGQWTYALAKNNKKVVAIDLLESRVNIAQDINSDNQNVEFLTDSIEKLPFDDNIFDAVHCRGVIMLVDTQKVIQEISRVLKPKGKIFINYNSYGYYLQSIVKDCIFKRNMGLFKFYMRGFKNSFNGIYKQAILSPNIIETLFKENNLKVIEQVGDFKISQNNISVDPFLKEKYFGFITGYEVLGEKYE